MHTYSAVVLVTRTFSNVNKILQVLEKYRSVNCLTQKHCMPWKERRTLFDLLNT